MSLVTNVLVHVGTLDTISPARLTEPQPWDDQQALGDLRGDRKGQYTLEYGAIKEAFKFWGGPKVPDWDLYGAAFNYLDWGSFVTWLLSLPWEYPDHVLVIVKGQEDDRPSVWEIVDGRLAAIT